MKIEISDTDFGTLCICALRYCHGRRSYMPSTVQEIVRSHFKDLSDTDLGIIAEDEEYQMRMTLWGDTCDRRSWEKFYKELKEYRDDKK